MNRNEAADLLTAVAARDQRTVGEWDAAAWAQDLAGVALADALDVLPDFYRSEVARSRRIVSADVVHFVRSRRRARVEFEHAASLRADAEEARRTIEAGGTDPDGSAMAHPGLRELHVESMRGPCPASPRGCGQPLGERCRRADLSGELVLMRIPHTARTVAAVAGETSGLSS